MWKSISGVISGVLFMIGLAGIPDDLKTWNTWLQPMVPFLDHWVTRVIIILVGLFLIYMVNRSKTLKSNIHPNSDTQKESLNIDEKHEVPPQPQFGCPIQRAKEDNLTWWHVPIRLKSRDSSPITSYEHCRARLIFQESNFLHARLNLRCQSDRQEGDSEFSLRLGEEPRLLPIARRTEDIDQKTQACPAYFTDEGYLLRGTREPRLEAGTYKFCIEIRHETLRWTSDVYILTVPGPRMSNGHFLLTKELGQ